MLPLLQTTSHPRLVASVLKLCREVLPRCPLYHPALPRHAIFRVLLLTGDSLSAHRQRSRANREREQRSRRALGQRARGAGGEKRSAQRTRDAEATDEASAENQFRFTRVGEGLCFDAAALIEELHLAHADTFYAGDKELSSAPTLAIARHKASPLCDEAAGADGFGEQSLGLHSAGASRAVLGPTDPTHELADVEAARATQCAEESGARLAPAVGGYPAAYGGVGGIAAGQAPALNSAGLLCAGAGDGLPTWASAGGSLGPPVASDGGLGLLEGGGAASGAGAGEMPGSAAAAALRPPGLGSLEPARPSFRSSLRRRRTTSKQEHTFDQASSLQMLLPPSLVKLVRKRGAAALCRVFNAKLHASSDALWSADMRRTLMRQLRRNLAPLLGWVKHRALARRRLHPAAPLTAMEDPRGGHGLSGLPALSGTGRLPSAWDCGAVQASPLGLPPVTGGAQLAYPSVLHTPAPRRVRFPQLDDEPRVAGVYLRVYVGGAPLPCASKRFLRSLLRGLHEEVAALSAAHLTLVEGTVDAAARLAGVEVKGAATVRARAGAAARAGGADVGKQGPGMDGGAGSALHRDGGVAISEVGATVDPSLLLAKKQGPGDSDGGDDEDGVGTGPGGKRGPRGGSSGGGRPGGGESAWDLARSYLGESDLSDDDEAAVAAAGGRRILSPTALYRRHHLRCLVTLQALARFLEDSPGAPMPLHVFGALAVLMGLPQGRYPAVAAQGIDTAGGFAVDESGRVDASGANVGGGAVASPLPSSFGLGGGASGAVPAARGSIASGMSEGKQSEGGASGDSADDSGSSSDDETAHKGQVGAASKPNAAKLRLSLDTTYSIDNLPPLPAPLLLLLPPAAVFDLDDDPFRDAFIDATRAASSRAGEETGGGGKQGPPGAPSRGSRGGKGKRGSARVRFAGAPDDGAAAAASGGAAGGDLGPLTAADSAVYAPLREQRQAERVRGLAQSAELQGESLLTAAIACLKSAICPAVQRVASREAVEDAADGGSLGALLGLIGWCVPLESAACREILRKAGADENVPPIAETADHGPILPSSASPAALSRPERARLWLMEPVLSKGLDVVRLACGSDAGVQLFLRAPHLAAPLLRCARAHWDEFDAAARARREQAALQGAGRRDVGGGAGGQGEEEDAVGGRHAAGARGGQQVVVLAGGIGGQGMWVPDDFLTAQSAMRLVAPALRCLKGLCEVYCLKRALLDMGVVVHLVQTAVAGPNALGQFPLAGEDPDEVPSPEALGSMGGTGREAEGRGAASGAGGRRSTAAPTRRRKWALLEDDSAAMLADAGEELSIVQAVAMGMKRAFAGAKQGRGGEGGEGGGAAGREGGEEEDEGFDTHSSRRTGRMAEQASEVKEEDGWSEI